MICTYIIIDLGQQIALNDLETRIEYLEQRNDSLVDDLAQERAKSAEERTKFEARLKKLEIDKVRDTSCEGYMGLALGWMRSALAPQVSSTLP
jgi:hypothetical protein